MNIFDEIKKVDISFEDFKKLNSLKGYLLYLSATGHEKSEEYIPVMNDLIKKYQVAKKTE